MTTTLTKLKLSLLLVLLFASVSSFAKVPPTCKRIECPSYDVIYAGNGYEIRHYNSTVWASTSPIQDISLVKATGTGFSRLFDYIQGKNDYKQKIEMTGPVVTEVSPSGGSLCESSFVVSFFVPKKNQANPPPAKDLHIQRWKPVYAAVRQFGGFVKDSNVGPEAAALNASIAGTKWSSAIEKSHRAGHNSVYTVAQYNDPFEVDERVNEIWLLFDLENGMHSI
ncbi:heme-binding protein 2-like [Neltuma alba]|uniref:heme-binding protein 2-like n=1 Tax=Neltuma alba TaxID=207710 RepID=UPI0010A313BC|nr:heme-binding protein 2-like [Prosopis alba]